MKLDHAVVYDIETFPNVFTIYGEELNTKFGKVWEISHFRDDRQSLIEWFNYLRQTQTPMIGFNNINFDYPMIHFIMKNPQCTVEQIYQKAMSIINSIDRFGHIIWADERFTPQIDLFRIHHFDNRAKTTSLKALEINMRADTVVDMPVPVGTMLTEQQTRELLIPYNKHDVKETKQFAHFSRKAIDFRIGLIDQLGIDVLNYADTKIGTRTLEKRIGENVCFDSSSGRKQIRQTVRYRIALNEIIFPYIKFNNPEFARVLNWLQGQVLTPEDLEDPDATIKTKGVFNGLKANVGGCEFYFGTGGIHASVPAQRIIATDEWQIRDIDVASLYPSIAIVNNLAPAHLGEAFTREYSKLPPERKEWQKKKGKKCVEANALKLAANGTYGNTNNKFSCFYDPQYTMQITINGQLILCMLAEWLCTVPTLQIIMANTDGITYRIHRDHLDAAKTIEKQWEDYTMLVLEDVSYSRMWIADVNSYVAESSDGSLKLKGRFWYPDGLNYADSISECQPPAWHKDLGNIVSIRAAVAAMVHGIDPETYIRCHTDPFDFMHRAKVDRASKLTLGGREIQGTSRYYVTTDGEPLVKISPPVKGAREGDWKRKSGIGDAEYKRILATLAPGEWSDLIHTKNKSKYETREISLQAGRLCTECNDAKSFRFENVDYSYYVDEARKLVI